MPKITIHNAAIFLLAASLTLPACSDDTVEPVPVTSTSVSAPFISYLNTESNTLWCSTMVNRCWHQELISYLGCDLEYFGYDLGVNISKYTSLAIDAQGFPHISYQKVCRGSRYVNLESVRFVQGQLIYAKKAEVGWETETIEETAYCIDCLSLVWPELRASIALDVHGNPHISYDKVDFIPDYIHSWMETEGYLKYAVNTGGSWESETICQTSYTNPWQQSMMPGSYLALDSQGKPHISYFDALDGGLKHTVKTGGMWDIETINAAADVTSDISLAIDSQDKPHVAYYNASSGDLMYAVRTDGVWEWEGVDCGGDVGQWPSLAIDARGTPHISYYDASNGWLRYATKIDGFWIIEAVDQSDDSGQGTSIALDTDGNPHIAYFAASPGDLRYAFKTDGSWSVELVDCGGTAGVYPSLAIGSQ